MTISILDYNAGNIQSVQRAISRNGGKSLIISSVEEVLSSDKLILPGVGHFGKAMSYLKESGLREALNEKVLVQKTPVLGICLGMQLMCTYSEEGETEGLGWFDTKVTRMRVKDTLRYKIPHTGWNGIEFSAEHQILKGLEQGSEFYFVHAYHVPTAPDEQVLTKTTYETEFVSGLKKEQIIGVQFHPEKSHEQGALLLKNFIEL